MIHELKEWAARHGYAVAWGDLSAVGAALEDIRRREAGGEVDAGVRRAWLPEYDDRARWPRENSRRVLLVAVPRPAHRVAFTVGGAPFEVLVPPTYVDYRRLAALVRAQLEADGPGARLGLEPLSAPLKSTAARLGLVEYGRNNVTYVPGMGSYFQLVGFLASAALELPADWRPQPPGELPTCAGCGLCVAECPTGAITEDRFLIRAERCRTLHNESPDPLPEHLPAASLECLIGCLDCQEACPENAGRLEVERSPVRFTEAETRALLRGAAEPTDPAAETLRAGIEALGLLHHADVLGRNLGILLRAREAGAARKAAS